MKLVFFHALPFGGAMWDELAPRFGRDWTAPDLPPNGTVASWARDALSSTGEQPLVVIGESIGGSAAVEVARARPDLVRSIVMIGAKAGVNRDPRARDAAVRLVTSRGVDEAWRAIWEPLLGPGASSDCRERARRAALGRARMDVVDGVRAFHDRRDDSAFLRRWRKPLVAISGEHDEAPKPERARALATGPDRRFHLVPDCGHYVHLERPDVLVRLLERAIDDVAMDAPTG